MAEKRQNSPISNLDAKTMEHPKKEKRCLNGRF